jgi:hypothetical protein
MWLLELERIKEPCFFIDSCSETVELSVIFNERDSYRCLTFSINIGGPESLQRNVLSGISSYQQTLLQVEKLRMSINTERIISLVTLLMISRATGKVFSTSEHAE